MLLGISTDNWVKILLGIIVLIGTPLGYFFGQRQKIRAEEKKTEIDGANAAKVAAASQQTADSAILNTVLTGGIGALKTVLESADTIKKLLETVQAQGQQIANIEARHFEDIGKLRVQYSEEKVTYTEQISGLRLQVSELNSKVETLTKEIEMKDGALSECAEVRRQHDSMKSQNALLIHRLEEMERSNNAFLYLWQAAAEKREDGATITLAEEAITRILQSQNSQTNRNIAANQPGAVANLAVSLTLQEGNGRATDTESHTPQEEP